MNGPTQAEGRLRGLIGIARALMQTGDPDDVLSVLLESATRMFAADGASLALVDEQTKELAFTAMEGRAKAEPFRIPLGQGITGHVVETREPILSNDVANDTRFYRSADASTGFKTKAIMCTPVEDRGRVIGALSVLNPRAIEGFTPDDLELLGGLAGLAGAALARARTQATERAAGAAMREEQGTRYRLVSGDNPAMRATLEMLETAAKSAATILLLGESGVGKEVAARAVHGWSARASAPFVAVNCTALTPTLLESELFGHEKGAFTGAVARKKGKFEMADGGTLFLDEIGDLAPELQTKLLRVLQDREFQRVGGSDTIRVDVRLLAATNKDLRGAMARGQFREDLFYRLNVVSVTLPPLRARRDDIPALAEHFLQRAFVEMKRPVMPLDAEAHALLCAYDWPGNVRELANVMERAVVLGRGPTISPIDLPTEVRQGRSGGPGLPVPAAPAAPGAGGNGHPAAGLPIDTGLPLNDQVKLFKRQRVEAALASTDGNQAQAAQILGMHAANLSRLMKTLGLRI